MLAFVEIMKFCGSEGKCVVCTIPGTWSVGYGSCSATACGVSGMETRTCTPSSCGGGCPDDPTSSRPCEGDYCDGDGDVCKNRVCVDDSCPIDGTWSVGYGSCSKECGGGIKTKTCTPSSCGGGCPDDPTSSRACNEGRGVCEDNQKCDSAGQCVPRVCKSGEWDYSDSSCEIPTGSCDGTQTAKCKEGQCDEGCVSCNRYCSGPVPSQACTKMCHISQTCSEGVCVYPVNGLCDGCAEDQRYKCILGTENIPLDEDGLSYTQNWECLGKHGGGDDPCSCRQQPIYGQCAGCAEDQRYECSVGISSGPLDEDDLSYTQSWECLGENGGRSASCSCLQLCASLAISRINGCETVSGESDNHYDRFRCNGVYMDLCNMGYFTRIVRRNRNDPPIVGRTSLGWRCRARIWEGNHDYYAESNCYLYPIVDGECRRFSGQIDNDYIENSFYRNQLCTFGVVPTEQELRAGFSEGYYYWTCGGVRGGEDSETCRAQRRGGSGSAGCSHNNEDGRTCWDSDGNPCSPIHISC